MNTYLLPILDYNVGATKPTINPEVCILGISFENLGFRRLPEIFADRTKNYRVKSRVDYLGEEMNTSDGLI